METDDKLILWSLGQRAMGSLDFAIQKLTWAEDLGLPLYDFQIALKCQGRELKGRATHRDESKALAIALTEAFERQASRGLDSGSNGLAAHTSELAAQTAARNELIERDAFLVSYLAGLPMMKVDWRELGLDDVLDKSLSNLAARGMQIQVFVLARSFDRHVVMAVISGLELGEKQFGLNVGLGCEADIAEASARALGEVVRNGYWALQTQLRFESTPLREFLANQEWTSRAHLKLALDLNYAPQILTDLSARAQRRAEPVHLETRDEFRFDRPHWSSEIPKPPLFFARATHPGLQKLFWGPSTPEKINWTRFENLGLNIGARLQTLLPHPLG